MCGQQGTSSASSRSVVGNSAQQNEPMICPVTQKRIPKVFIFKNKGEKNLIFFLKYINQRFCEQKNIFSTPRPSQYCLLFHSSLCFHPPTHVQPSSLFPQSGAQTLFRACVPYPLSSSFFFRSRHEPGQQVTLEDQ